jgi:hypothetical protein
LPHQAPADSLLLLLLLLRQPTNNALLAMLHSA